MSVTRKPSYDWIASVIRIKTKRKYPIEELLELMQQNLGDKYGLLEVKDRALVIGKEIAVKGVDKYTIFIWPTGTTLLGHTIIIRQEKEMPKPEYTVSGCIFGFISNILGMLTFGIKYWQIWGIRKNWHIMKPLSEDIAKLIH